MALRPLLLVFLLTAFKIVRDSAVQNLVAVLEVILKRVTRSLLVAMVKAFAEGQTSHLGDHRPYSKQIGMLKSLDWDFSDANTGYLTHGLHPYAAKFIPQIPNTLIQELSGVGETILDPFCGSGTTLVEAARLRRNAIGIDANPLACLISRAKTAVIDESSEEIDNLRVGLRQLAQDAGQTTLPLFRSSATLGELPPDDIDGWFDEHVIDELCEVRSRCRALENDACRHLALACFSSIVVNVSKQNSETRYVRREKGTKPGDVYRLVLKALDRAIERAFDFAEEADPHCSIVVVCSSVLDQPQIPMVDLVVCSPPYPNAYSYHLYHRTRMLWLGMDQPKFKIEEIGSHRKYSSKSKNAADENTFRSEMCTFFRWIGETLKRDGLACIVIGDSKIRGNVIENDQLLVEAAAMCGFTCEANMTREIKKTKKSFNPSIGRIRDEHILVLRNRG